MRKILKLFVILIVSLLMMVACGNDDITTEDNGESTNESTSETDQTENNNVEDESNQETEENGESDSSDVESDDEVPVLELGETGVMETILGTYEITVNSFWFADELSDSEETFTPGNGIYVVTDITMKNIGEEDLELESIMNARLLEGDGGIAGTDNYPTLEKFTEEITQGESATGQVAFNYFVEDYYELSFGYGLPTDVSNEVRWAIHAEDAE